MANENSKERKKIRPSVLVQPYGFDSEDYRRSGKDDDRIIQDIPPHWL